MNSSHQSTFTFANFIFNLSYPTAGLRSPQFIAFLSVFSYDFVLTFKTFKVFTRSSRSQQGGLLFVRLPLGKDLCLSVRLYPIDAVRKIPQHISTVGKRDLGSINLRMCSKIYTLILRDEWYT